MSRYLGHDRCDIDEAIGLDPSSICLSEIHGGIDSYVLVCARQSNHHEYSYDHFACQAFPQASNTYVFFFVIFQLPGIMCNMLSLPIRHQHRSAVQILTDNAR